MSEAIEYLQGASEMLSDVISGRSGDGPDDLFHIGLNLDHVSDLLDEDYDIAVAWQSLSEAREYWERIYHDNSTDQLQDLTILQNSIDDTIRVLQSKLIRHGKEVHD